VLDSARAIAAREIEIVGYRGAVLLSNGQRMVEAEGIARRRAEQVAMLLQGVGLTSAYKVRWEEQAATPTGIDDHLLRRVVVIIRR
jgi:osmotically-inducible protein OsmY